MPLAGTPHGEALATQHVQVVDEPDGGVRLFAPVTNRGEAIGVLELRLAGDVDERVLDDVALTAHALAYVIIANRRFTDLFEWGQRSVPLSIAAEIQHRLLPGAYTCEAGQFTLAAWLEPAGNVGGDTFDFSLDRETLHLSMTDAMGHTVEAAVLATVLVGALRNARRAGAGSPSRRPRRHRARRLRERRGVRHRPARPRRPALGPRAHRQRRPPAADPHARRPHRGRRRSAPIRPSPRRPDGPTNRRSCRSNPVTGSCSSPTACSSATPPIWSWSDSSPRGRTCMRARPSSTSSTPLLELTGGELEDDASVLCLDWHGGPPRDRETVGGANA